MLTEILSGRIGLEKGAALIKMGEVVAFPTETVYGLGANALNPEAVNKIFLAKGRPSDNPLIVHVADFSGIGMLTLGLSPIAERAAEAFMPGPITLVIKKSQIVPYNVTAGLDTVGVRMPGLALAREFIKECGMPIAAPSANSSTHISPTSAEHVFNDLSGKIPLIIDGGSSTVGIESTVVDVTGETPVILRPGRITAEMLEDTLKCHVIEKTSSAERPASPGMKYRHYSPIKPLRILKTREEVLAAYDESIKNGINAVILTSAPLFYGGRHIIYLGASGEEVASSVYAALHSAEKEYDLILSEDFDFDAVGHSVMNRLTKASERK